SKGTAALQAAQRELSKQEAKAEATEAAESASQRKRRDREGELARLQKAAALRARESDSREPVAGAHDRGRARSSKGLDDRATSLDDRERSFSKREHSLATMEAAHTAKSEGTSERLTALQEDLQQRESAIAAREAQLREREQGVAAKSRQVEALEE